MNDVCGPAPPLRGPGIQEHIGVCLWPMITSTLNGVLSALRWLCLRPITASLLKGVRWSISPVNDHISAEWGTLDTSLVSNHILLQGRFGVCLLSTIASPLNGAL